MDTIGRFRILKRLGGGGFGEVFLGEDPAIGRQVAIKVFRPKDENLIAFATSSDQEGLQVLRERFLNEARILASLDNATHVVGVLDYGELDDGSPYYVMPYLPHSLSDELGKDVFDAMAVAELPEDQRPRALPLERCIPILEQLCRGLAAAHQRGLIHRDIKPANIMLTEDGEVRLVDFGIAKAPDGQHSTVSHLGMGSRNYMAPEQRESAKHVDARADVYALGRVAYRMLTGKLPVGRFADPNVAVPALGKPLNDLILMALAEDREQRPKDAGELLQQFLDAKTFVGQTSAQDTGTWVSGGEAGVRDDLKPLRARIAELVGAQGLIHDSDRPGLRALAAIADLEDDDLDELIQTVIDGDNTLSAKHKLARVIGANARQAGVSLPESLLASYDSAAAAVGWNRVQVEAIVKTVPTANMAETHAAARVPKNTAPSPGRKHKTGTGTKRGADTEGVSGDKTPAFSSVKDSRQQPPRRWLRQAAPSLFIMALLGGAGYGVHTWRQTQLAEAEQAQHAAQAAAELEQAWGAASKDDSQAAYQAFLASWPEGPWSEEARQRLAGLEADTRRAQAAAASSQRERIAGIQDYLNRLGYRVPESGEVEVRTESAIKAFEKSQGLLVTGNTDEVLLTTLQEAWQAKDDTAWEQASRDNTETAYRAYIEAQPRGRYVAEVDTRIEAVRQAAREVERQRISAIQQELKRLGQKIAVDGTMTAGTAGHIRAFERAAELPERGEPTQTLLAALKQAEHWPGIDPKYLMGGKPHGPTMEGFQLGMSLDEFSSQLKKQDVEYTEYEKGTKFGFELKDMSFYAEFDAESFHMVTLRLSASMRIDGTIANGINDEENYNIDKNFPDLSRRLIDWMVTQKKNVSDDAIKRFISTEKRQRERCRGCEWIKITEQELAEFGVPKANIGQISADFLDFLEAADMFQRLKKYFMIANNFSEIVNESKSETLSTNPEIRWSYCILCAWKNYRKIQFNERKSTTIDYLYSDFSLRRYRIQSLEFRFFTYSGNDLSEEIIFGNQEVITLQALKVN